MVAEWLVRLARRIEPREGWPLFLVAWLTILFLPLAAAEADWVPGLGWLLAWSISWGYLAAFWLSRLAGRLDRGPESGVLPGWSGALLLAGVGLLLVGLAAGWHDAPAALEAMSGLERLLLRVVRAEEESFRRVAAWLGAVRQGQAQQDDLVFGWLLGLLAWAAGAWAGWWLYRRERPWEAMLPAGFLLAMEVYFAWEGRFYLPFFLAMLVVVVVLRRRLSLEGRWQRRGMDYSEAIRLDSGLAALFLAGLAASAALTMPRVVVRPTAAWFARMAAEPLAAAEEAGQQLFPGLRRQPGSLLASGGRPGGLPRAFLLGSGPELSEQPVLRVSTDELAALPPGQPAPASFSHYWRALTFDTYDGRGWGNSAGEVVELEAGEAWQLLETTNRRPLRQSVETLRAGDLAIFAAGEPLAVSRPYEAELRAPGDLIALQGRSRRYEVLSLVPAGGEATLRAAGGAYPPDLAGRYLQLPDLAPRVGDLARAVAEGAATPYDRALALEAFLRTFRYDLDVDPPPPGREVTDYFLFDAQAGYCDYYATAMVVLARSLGIPARLASGYATGDYDAAARAFMVAEDSAHSWPELYFPEAGWVPFEPTAARPLLVRATDAMPATAIAGAAGDLERDLQLFREDEIVRRRLRWLAAGALAGLGVLAAGLWHSRRRGQGLVAWYGELMVWGRRLGRPAGAGETAREFGEGLQQAVLESDVEQAGQAARGVGRFVAGFEAAQYGPGGAEAEEGARSAWQGLRPALRRLWLARLVGGAVRRH